MTEAARLSVAVEVTGEEAFKQSMAGIERSGQKAKAAVDAAASGMGKDLAQLDAMIAKSVGGITAAIDRQTASIGKGFAQVSAQMRLVQSGVGSAATSVEKDAGRAQSAFDRMDSLIARNTASIQAALGQIAPASAAMASDIGQSSQAMASFEAAAASMNAATANLQGSIRDVSAAMAKFNAEASKPANDNPYDKPAKGAASLRAQLNPLFAVGEQYHAQVARIRQAHADGAIGAAEMAMALQRAGAVADASQRQYLKMDDALGAAGGAARLTSFQMTNLGYQVNDIGTMMLMGASPFQIMASQAGQVVQALGDNPQGVGGSLRAIGSGIASFARAIPAAGYAVAGLTAAVAGVYALTRGPQARSAEESVGSFEEAVKSLQGAWAGAGDAAEDYFRRAMGGAGANPDAAMLDVQARLRELRADYEAEIRSFNEDPSLGQRIAAPNYGGWSEARHRVRDLYRELLNGTIGAREMADEMTRIAIDANVELATRGLANGIRELLPEAIDLEARIASISETVDNLAGRGARVLGNAGASTPFDLRDRFGGGVTDPFERLNPEGMATIRDGLRAQREEIEDASKTVDKYADSLRGLRDGWTGDIEALRLQVRMHGETEGAVAAARYQYEALAEARRLAADNEHLFDENGADAMRIREVAAEIGNLTDQLAGMKEAEAQAKRVADALADLQFQGSIIGLSEVEQNVSRQLHQLKLDTQSLDGQRIADAIRYNATLEETEDRLETQRQLVENVASTFLDIFTDNSSDSFFDRILGGLADISRQFAELGKQRLLDMFTGGAVGYTSGFPAPGQRSVAPVGVGGISASGGGVRLYAPSGAQPSNASQAITEQLSANVTKTVSDNLLRNMLGSGKDPSHIRGLNADFASSLTQMFEAAPDAVRASITINSGFRSVARQAELFEGALKKYGSEAAARKWVAPPGRSQHNFGRAVDLGYGNSAAREWVHSNAGRFGMHFPMSHENWHLEPINARSGGNATAMRSAVAGGVVDAQRALASGQAGISASSVPVPTARPAQAASSGGALGGGLNGLRGFMQSPLGMGGLNALSAFGAGASSGSPISGGFSGALGALAIPGAGIGIAALGAAAGPIGGTFGRKEKRA